MKNKAHVGELKAQAACSLRLAEATAGLGQEEGEKIDQFVGDSWFTSVQTGLALMEQGYQFAGVVKTCHAGYPRAQIEALMSDWPGGTSVVFTAGNLVATGYKYNSRKVVCFLSSKNFEGTILGDPYISRWVDETGNRSQRAVPRPAALSKYFQVCNGIDAHNQARQAYLGLEELWATDCPWFRLVTTFIGMTVTDMWKATRHAVEGSHFLSTVSIKKFAELVGMEMIKNKLPTENYGGKRAIQKPLSNATSKSPVRPVETSPDSSALYGNFSVPTLNEAPSFISVPVSSPSMSTLSGSQTPTFGTDSSSEYESQYFAPIPVTVSKVGSIERGWPIVYDKNGHTIIN